MWKRQVDDLRRDVKMNTEAEANVLMNSTNNTRREVTGLERRIQEDIEQMRHESVYLARNPWQVLIEAGWKWTSTIANLRIVSIQSGLRLRLRRLITSSPYRVQM